MPPLILDLIKRLVPPLDGSLHKGQSGRVGVLGGALDYTGAPFFAAMSAQRFGVDLSHVICSPTAAGAIKSYSPDLIVHPILRENSSTDDVTQDLQSILSRLHVVVIGPGLGREQYMQKFAKITLSLARQMGLFLVLDADALIFVGQDPSVIQGYRRAVVTPNVVEFKRLSEKLGMDPNIPLDKKARAMSKILGGVTVLQKGPKDTIAAVSTTEQTSLEASHLDGNIRELENVDEIVEVDVPGGLKRCGGQGDILTGAVGTFLAWGKCYEDGAFGDRSIPTSCIPLLAAVGGSMVTRATSRLAFQKHGRSVVTQDMLSEIGGAFVSIFKDEFPKHPSPHQSSPGR